MSIRSIFPPILASLLLTIAVSAATPSIEYKIQIKETDLSGFDVEMLVPRVRGTLRIAMAAHPEYDDRYWRYIENFSATDRRGRALPFTKEEDTVWRIENARGETLVRYRLHLPSQQPGSIRDAWKPFLTPNGGMVGDLHSLMYVVGDTSRRARLTLSMPNGWKAAGGLEPTRDARVFTGTVELMLDSPLLVGSLSEHDFRAGGCPAQNRFLVCRLIPRPSTPMRSSRTYGNYQKRRSGLSDRRHIRDTRSYSKMAARRLSNI
jgi:predicted metalloprotease with PDZ domain